MSEKLKLLIWWHREMKMHMLAINQKLTKTKLQKSEEFIWILYNNCLSKIELCKWMHSGDYLQQLIIFILGLFWDINNKFNHFMAIQLFNSKLLKNVTFNLISAIQQLDFLRLSLCQYFCYSKERVKGCVFIIYIAQLWYLVLILGYWL